MFEDYEEVLRRDMENIDEQVGFARSIMTGRISWQTYREGQRLYKNLLEARGRAKMFYESAGETDSTLREWIEKLSTGIQDLEKTLESGHRELIKDNVQEDPERG